MLRNAGLLSLIWLLLLGARCAAAETDVVVFVNGDRLTGEVKSMSRGRLQFDADATGVISIKWTDVAFLQVEERIQVEVQNGDRYFGTLGRGEENQEITVQTSRGKTVLPTNVIVAINQIDAAGLSNIDLRVSVGYNYTNAGNVTQLNVAVDSAYRTRDRIWSGSFASSISDSTGNEASQRKNLSLNYTRLRSNRWLNDAGLSLDTNDELDLNLRTSLSVGGGRFLLQSNSSNFILKGGLKATRENIVDQPEDLNSLESYGLVKWEWFRYDTPKLDWSTSLELIPSLTESGRLRGELDMTLNWEIIGDLSWQLDFYDSYDNKPQSDTTPKNDYGITTSLSYDF